MATELYMTPALAELWLRYNSPAELQQWGRITVCHLSTWYQQPMSSHACIPSPMIAGSMEST